MSSIIKFASYFLLFSLSLVADASTLFGKVIGIADGDTLTVLASGNIKVRIRLDSIDAPEASQLYGNQSKATLSSLVYGKQVLAVYNKIDRYGRPVATVYLSKSNINLVMVRRGMAWVYRQYAWNQAYYAQENYARKYKLGLWVQKSPQAPWDYRRIKLNLPASIFAITTPTSGDFTCGTKHYCSQMKSGLEADYYLFKCGVKTMDGDNDGVPCEILR